MCVCVYFFFLGFGFLVVIDLFCEVSTRDDFNIYRRLLWNFSFYFFLFLLLAPRGGVIGLPFVLGPYTYLRLSAGFKIWNEHINESSTDIMAPVWHRSANGACTVDRIEAWLIVVKTDIQLSHEYVQSASTSCEQSNCFQPETWGNQNKHFNIFLLLLEIAN